MIAHVWCTDWIIKVTEIHMLTNTATQRCSVALPLPYILVLHFVISRWIIYYCDKRLLALSCPSVCLSAWNNSAPTGRIFMKSDVWVFLENLSREFKFNWNMTRIMGTFSQDLCTFIAVSCWVIFRVRNLSGKNCTENKNTHLTFKSFSENCVVYEIMWKNMVEPDRRHVTM